MKRRSRSTGTAFWMLVLLHASLLGKRKKGKRHINQTHQRQRLALPLKHTVSQTKAKGLGASSSGTEMQEELAPTPSRGLIADKLFILLMMMFRL